MQEPEKRMLRLEGVVDKVLFFNEQNGYIVLELETDQSIETVVGELGEIEDGETLLVEGEYITHSKFGTQFKASYCERKLPSTAENIRKYLSSGTISGIGPSLAKRIVDVFGDETLEVMEHQPEKLRTIKGISEKKCQEIAREVQRALVEELYRGACPKHDPVQCFDRAYAEAFIEECQPMLDDVWRRFQE